jgi:deferrochelatase/peroxidase EfeB
MPINCDPPYAKNVQGLILRGYTHPFSCHLLFNFTNPSKIASPDPKAFFKTLYPHVQSAEDWGEQKPKWMLNIGLTSNGIQALNVFEDPSTLETYFPSEFVAGPWSGGSQSSLGDAGGPGDPSTWWYNNFQNEDLHCVVHTYGLTQADLDEVIGFVTDAAKSSGLTELFALKDKNSRLTQYQPLGDNIHFGYRDGISEPELNWSGKLGVPDQSDLNNFLIGYPNGSLIQPGPSSPAPDDPVSIAAASFAADGCYNAFRILYQNVAAFNTLLAEQANQWATNLGLSQKEAQEWFAAKLMGRWRNGSPLMLSPDGPDPCTQEGENFGYIEQNDSSPFQDMNSGVKCPFSAHTRVANPRNEDLVPAEGTSGPPRILRRGMPYGPVLNSTTDDGVDRGLIGLFLCGSPARQFEIIYSWMNMNNFSSIFPDTAPAFPQDAVLGNRNPQNQLPVDTSFIIPMPAPKDNITIPNLDNFIVTRGTAYCLLPSLASLRLIAGL